MSTACVDASAFRPQIETFDRGNADATSDTEVAKALDAVSRPAHSFLSLKPEAILDATSLLWNKQSREVFQSHGCVRRAAAKDWRWASATKPLLVDHANVDQQRAQRIQELTRLHRSRMHLGMLLQNTELWKLAVKGLLRAQ